jgi:adenosylcobinamide kinase / adenosylcobinamide-phosphate guanylyltransferase
MSTLILITGGVRSGKSSCAQYLAKSFKREVIYIATAEALDPGMKERIRQHKKSRDKSWVTIEEPLDVLGAVKKLSAGKRVILLDCLTLFISNLILKGLSDKAIYTEVKSILKALKPKSDAAIIVTNEVGSGIVPDSELGIRFRDLQGRVNQIVSGEADSVYLLVSGIPVKIK